MNKYLSIILLFALIFTSSNLPVYSLQPSCAGGFTSAYCPKGTQNVSCPFETFNRCTPQGPRCCRISVMINPDFSVNFDDIYDCGAGIIPECVCNTSQLINVCNGLGIPNFNTCDCDILVTTFTCNPGFISCPNNFTKGSCCSVAVGCCPSNPTQCKCPNSNQCIPNCTVAPPPPTTYECDPGYTICPNNTTPNALCCQYGCCPSNPTQCKCSNNNQCYPNCSVPTSPSTTQPTTTSPTNSSGSVSTSESIATLNISGVGTINATVNFKRYLLDLVIISTNLTQTTPCTIFPTIAGLGIRIQPNTFFLNNANNSKTVKATIPISRVVKRLNSITFKVNCGNLKAEKTISILK